MVQRLQDCIFKSCTDRGFKCDEIGPPCGPCQTRQIECTFPPRQAHSVTPVPTGQLKISPSLPEDRSRSSNSSRTLAAPITPEPALEGSKRLLELELMHQYTVSTYECFTGEYIQFQSLVLSIFVRICISCWKKRLTFFIFF